MSIRIVVLHGTNYWSMGDLALMITLLKSLQREFDRPEITILSTYANRPRPTNQTFDVTQLGAVEKPGLTIHSLRSKHSLSEGAVFLVRAVLVLTYLLVRRVLGIRLTVLLPRDLADSINTLYEADLIISKPCGSLYDLGESTIPAPHHLLSILAATLTDKPVVIYAQSIGPFKRPVFHGLVRFVMDRTRLVIVRDEPSLQECQKILQLRRTRIELTADEAFLLTDLGGEVGRERLSAIGVPSEIPLVGLTVLNWGFPNVSNPQLKKARYIKAIAELIDYINNHYRAHVNIFPFVLAGAYPRNDEKITEQVRCQASYPDMVHVCRETDPRIIKSLQSEMEVFVGSRMHSNILALSSYVPVLAISYLPKTNGIMAMLGLSDFVLDINTLQFTDLQVLFDRVWHDRVKIRARLKQVIPEIQVKALQNARLTKSVLENTAFHGSRSASFDFKAGP